ncbi:hypothetical protein Tco_0410321 [Tanacetum coccineum]
MNIRMSRLEKAINEKNATTPATVKVVEEVCVTYGVSKTDFESYAKANDANMNNLQMKLDNFQRNQNDFQRSYNDSQKKQDDFQNLMLGFMQNYHNNSTASTSRPGTLPSQTVTNPREQINAITTRSGKTLEGPSTPLVPTPVVSKPQKEPEQNPETSTEKVQNPNLENTAHVPPPEEEESIFMEIPKPKAKKTVNVEIQDLNSPRPNSHESSKIGKFSYPMCFKELIGTSDLADSGAAFNLLPHSIITATWAEALTPTPNDTRACNLLLNTPLSDKVECFAPEDNNDEIDDFLAMEVSSNFEEGYFDSEGDVTFLDNLLSDDTTHNLAFEVIFDHEPEQNESSILPFFSQEVILFTMS